MYSIKPYYTADRDKALHEYDKGLITKASSQDLESIYPEITHFTKLAISGYTGKQMPPIGKLVNLEELEINRAEQLLTLPEDIGQLKNLKKLQIESRAVCVLPLSFGDLSNLEELTLNGFKDDGYLSEILPKLTSLKKLGISSFHGASLPSLVSDLSSLQELKIGGCNELQDLLILKSLPKLTKLSLYENVILPSFPDQLSFSKKLQELEINNRLPIQSIPDIIGELTELESIEVRSGSWTSEESDPFGISPAIGKLQKLRKLKLKPGTKEALPFPESIGNLANLEELKLNWYSIEKLPSSIGNLKKLKTLYINFSDLTELPSEIGGLESLELLYIHGSTTDKTKLTTLPPEIGKLKQLKTIEIDDDLTDLPDTLGDCENLETLKLIAPKSLQRIPESIGRLSKLQSLTLSGIFSQLPESIGNLQNLTNLELPDSPQLVNLPSTISQCTKLGSIEISRTGIQRLSTDLYKLTRLWKVSTHATDTQFAPRQLEPEIFDWFYPFRHLAENQHSDMDEEKRKIYLHVYLNNFYQERLENRPQQVFFEGFSINYAPMHQALIENIFVFNEKYQSLSDKPLKPGDVVAILGNTSYKKTDIKNKLTAANIGYSSSLTDKVTHILVGSSPKFPENGNTQKNYFLFNEKELTDFLNQVEQPYLLSEEGRSSDSTESVLKLLRSPESVNEALGVQLLESTGVPAELIIDLLVIAKTSDNPDTRAKARQLIKKNTTDGVILQALAYKAKIIDDTSRYSYNRFQIHKYQQEFPGLDTASMAFLVWLKKEKVIKNCFAGEYFMEHSDANDPRRQLYIEQTTPDWLAKTNELELKAALTTEEANTLFQQVQPTIWKITLKGNHLTSFPEEMLHIISLTNLTIYHSKILEIPESIAQLKNLKHLVLFQYNLHKLPLSLSTLPLESLELKTNRVENLDILKERMPSCQFR
ncbi:hypothetical protein QNI19_14290 [Cytophagaceae bacterium DM2B3-1]|uniref:Disease resistance R13L4/SHOC-2-like LRR domain-containing protein n=1 Tax=Xanthocytophaga flava TaxID=3048013 RepID=A0ABT7CN43_9BACT|nr:hypothetical protein [Xanthocytophaga flavus]MDJ1494109.1 hypothetical protein [Xanthocytophaga flavus]